MKKRSYKTYCNRCGCNSGCRHYCDCYFKAQKHKTMLAEHTKTLTKKQAYITGGGLSAFASALYLVRDCGFTPENIHIFTNGTRNCGNNETGFICRRGKTISLSKTV